MRILIELFLLDSNAWNYLSVEKQMKNFVKNNLCYILREEPLYSVKKRELLFIYKIMLSTNYS